MEGFVPGLREGVLSLNEALRVVVYFLCVAGLILRVHRGRADAEGLTRPVLRAATVVALVATMPWWFGYGEKVFLTAADTIQTGYTEHPMRAAAMIREGTTEAGSGFSLRRLEESYFRATFWAGTKMVIWLGTLLQFPFLLLQHVLKLLCLLFMPVALGLFMVPSLEGLAVRYLQQSCAVLAWPVGFAVTELVGYHLWTAFYQNMMVALDLTAGKLDASSIASLLGGLLGALWLIIGTLATPFLMQSLFCSGVPMSHGARPALASIASMQQVFFLAAAMKSGGATAALAMGRSAVAAGTAAGRASDGPPKARTSI